MTGCVRWLKSVSPSGYAYTMFKNKWITVHRTAWIYFNGEIPKGMCICHKCDVRNCVNPSHLFLGTQSDNIKDMYNKNRGVNNKGSRHGMAKLTEIEVKNIRKIYSLGTISQRKLARQYNISQRTVSDIILNRYWRHV